MGESIYPAEAKAILFLLTAHQELAEPIIEKFSTLLGPVEHQSPWHPFTHSSYYEKELGPNLKRCLISFKNLFEPHRLAELKRLATEQEKLMTHDPSTKLRAGSCRMTNIDPGYLDLFKVVLASAKAGGMKTALTAETFAYPILRFAKGGWHPFEWTFPDFKEETYHRDLLKIRESLKHRLSSTRPASGNPS